jgi:hypothetical protein
MALRRSDESNDFRAQDNPSHTAMTTSPANASAIKYGVMSFSFLNQSCGMIACAIISGTNLISIKWRPACGRGLAPRRVPARSGVPANERGKLFSQGTERRSLGDFSSTLQGSDGNPLATFRRCR